MIKRIILYLISIMIGDLYPYEWNDSKRNVWSVRSVSQ